MILEMERLFVRNWLISDVRQYIILANDVGYSCFSAPAIFLVGTTEEAKQKIQDRMVLVEEKRGQVRYTPFFCGVARGAGSSLERQVEAPFGHFAWTVAFGGEVGSLA